MKNSALVQRRFWFLLAATSLVAGCRDPKPVAYRTPKEKDAPGVTVQAPAAMGTTNSGALPEGHPDIGGAAPMASGAAPAASGLPTMPGMGGMTDMAMADTSGIATASGAGLAWTAPASWTAKPAGGMRKGSYAIPGAGGAVGDLGITAFPGDVGGDAANVNRWRGQLQLPPVSAAEAVASIKRQTQAGLEIGVVEIVGQGAAANRLLGAMVPFHGSTWFFKLTGPDALVAGERATFLEFLKTIQPAPAATTP